MRVDAAYFEITNLCNLNCITCYNRSGLNQVRQEMTLAQVLTCIDRLSTEFGCRSFSFAGGEPMLYSGIDELLTYMQEHTEFNFSFVTNGTMHNSQLISLVRSDPKRFRVQISLDGSSEAINCLTRGRGVFPMATALLDQIASPDFHPILKMVISQKNLSDVEAFYHLAVSHGAVPDFAFINKNGNAVDDWESKGVSPRQKIQVLKLLERLNQDSPLQAALPHPTGHCSLDDPEAPMSVLIKNNGNLHPCQLLYDDAYCFGNLLTDSAEQLLSGLRRIRQLAVARTQQDYQCHRCPMRDTCGKGCIAMAVYNTGDPLGEDGDCLTRKLEILDIALSQHLQKEKE